MNVNQFVSLVIFLALVGAIVVVVEVFVPSLARQRMIVELSKRREALRQLCEDEPAVAEHGEVRRLDELIAFLIRRGRPPGMTLLIGAYLKVRSSRAEEESLPAAFRGLTSSQRFALYTIGHDVSLEALRASLLGSRFWFLAWPVWLHIAGEIRDSERLTRDSNDDRQLGQVIEIGAHRLDPRTLLHA